MTVNRDAFDEFLRQFEPNDETSSKRYRTLRKKLIRFFAWKQVEDPEGLADETIGRVVASIHRGTEIQNSPGYIQAVATNVLREFVRQRSRNEIEILEHQVSEPDIFAECSRECLDALSEDKRKLIEAYYNDAVSRESVARELNISVAGLRIKVRRIRMELRSCYRDCMEKTLRSN